MLLGFLLGFIISALSFGLGLYVALLFGKSETFERVADRLPKRDMVGTPRVSLVDRPTAAEVNRQGTIEEEGDEEFSKILNEVGLRPKR